MGYKFTRSTIYIFSLVGCCQESNPQPPTLEADLHGNISSTIQEIALIIFYALLSKGESDFYRTCKE